MKCKTMILWWLANNKEHPQLEKGDKQIEALMPLVSTMFPGINYYGLSGFNSTMIDCVIPALKSRFPELLTTPADAITADMTTEVSEVLPCTGYEWQTGAVWQSKFKDVLAQGKRTRHASAGTEQQVSTTSQSYACSLVATIRGEVTHAAMLLGFKKPLTKEEATAEALQACMQQYPPSKGWEHHGVSVAAFDAQKLAEQLASA